MSEVPLYQAVRVDGGNDAAARESLSLSHTHTLTHTHRLFEWMAEMTPPLESRVRDLDEV